MNAVQYAINHVKSVIPLEVLRYAFLSDEINKNLNIWGEEERNLNSLDSHITNKVINKKVNVDCNLKTGKFHIVDLTVCPYKEESYSTKIYTIPYSLTEDKKIIGVESVNYFVSSHIYEEHAVSEIAVAGQNLFNAIRNHPDMMTTDLDILSDNVVLVRSKSFHVYPYSFLICTIEDGMGMENLPRTSYMTYAKLVEYVTKNYIYNTCVVGMDKGRLFQGRELGIIKSVIDGYSDAYKNYEDYYNENWGRSNFYRDKKKLHRYVNDMFARGM